jgi:hypothetical protein
MIYNIGVMLTDVSGQQGLCCTKNLYELALDDYRIAPIIFYANYAVPYTHINIGMMQDIEAWDYKGIVIATDIPTLKKLLNCPCPTHKFLYIWDFEWMTMDIQNFSELKNYYLNPEVELIVRTQEHFDIIAKVWKKPFMVIEDFNKEGIRELLNKVG